MNTHVKIMQMEEWMAATKCRRQKGTWKGTIDEKTNCYPGLLGWSRPSLSAQFRRHQSQPLIVEGGLRSILAQIILASMFKIVLRCFHISSFIAKIKASTFFCHGISLDLPSAEMKPGRLGALTRAQRGGHTEWKRNVS